MGVEKFYSGSIKPENALLAITSKTIQKGHQNAQDKGFWNLSQNIPEKLCLIHSEISEVLEELRKPEPDMEAIAEELADVCIRVFDLAGYLKIDLLKAIDDKMTANEARPHLHGKRF